MIFYQLDYVVEEIRKNEPSVAQRTLKKLVGEDYTKSEAERIWERVNDHKWYVGERLQRDIGLRAAAVDYVENFYDPSSFRRHDRQNGFFDRLGKSLSSLTRSYLTSKSKTLSSL